MAEADQLVESALDLVRRMPPEKVEGVLSDILSLRPELIEDLLSAVDQPLKVRWRLNFFLSYESN